MSEFHLVIGNKNYSSWSLRPWMLMTHLGVKFRETILPLDTARFKDEIARYSPTGRVPALLHGELAIWDSLAICEYVAELTGRGWPVDRTARLRAGAHFIPVGAAATIANDEGYMTSVAFSPILGHWIGLGVLKRGPERIGQRMRAYDPVRSGDVEVEICSPHFFDPQGGRLNG